MSRSWRPCSGRCCCSFGRSTADGSALVWLAAAVCAASVGSRVIGVGVAGAMIATLLFHTGRLGQAHPRAVGAGARRAIRGVVSWCGLARASSRRRTSRGCRIARSNGWPSSATRSTRNLPVDARRHAAVRAGAGRHRPAADRRRDGAPSDRAANGVCLGVVCRRLDHRQACGPCRVDPVRARSHLGPARNRRRRVVRAGMAGRPASVVGRRRPA